MDWFASLNLNYWIIIAGALAALNVYQFARARGLTDKLDHIFQHGHPAPGTVLIPAANVAVAAPADVLHTMHSDTTKGFL